MRQFGTVVVRRIHTLLMVSPGQGIGVALVQQMGHSSISNSFPFLSTVVNGMARTRTLRRINHLLMAFDRTQFVDLPIIAIALMVQQNHRFSHEQTSVFGDTLGAIQ